MVHNGRHIWLQLCRARGLQPGNDGPDHVQREQAVAVDPVPYIAMVKGVRGPREKSSRNR